MPSGRNRIKNMPAIQLSGRDEIKRRNEETDPTCNEDGVRKQVGQQGHAGDPGCEDAVQERDGQRLVKLNQRRRRASVDRPRQQNPQDRYGDCYDISGIRSRDADFNQRPARGNPERIRITAPAVPLSVGAGNT